MDFKDLVKQLGERVVKLKDNIQTEEATKNAFIMPFIQALGYDVFNPLEVVPEYVTDIGTKKGEKIDYLILKEGVPTILIECKHWKQNLDIHDGQLLRYFHVSKAKFAILTNGIQYRFYTDLDELNKMDEKPFLEFDITEIKDVQTEELKKFHKSYFEIDKILSTASELKYISEIKSIIASELKSPSEAYVKYFVSKVYPGRATEKIMQQFGELVKKSNTQVISDIITERLKTALTKESSAAEAEQVQVEQITAPDSTEKRVETTAEEMEAFFIVRSMLRGVVKANRIVYRDAQSYFSVLLDDNNRKPICRLYLNGSKKYIGYFSSDKKEIKSEISSLDDLFSFQINLNETLKTYLNDVS
jgi:hypothetical protein